MIWEPCEIAFVLQSLAHLPGHGKMAEDSEKFQLERKLFFIAHEKIQTQPREQSLFNLRETFFLSNFHDFKRLAPLIESKLLQTKFSGTFEE